MLLTYRDISLFYIVVSLSYAKLLSTTTKHSKKWWRVWAREKKEDKNHSKSPHRFKRLDKFIFRWGCFGGIEVKETCGSLLTVFHEKAWEDFHFYYGNFLFTLTLPFSTSFNVKTPHAYSQKPHVLICHIRLSSYCLKHIFIQIFFSCHTISYPARRLSLNIHNIIPINP